MPWNECHVVDERLRLLPGCSAAVRFFSLNHHTTLRPS